MAFFTRSWWQVTRSLVASGLARAYRGPGRDFASFGRRAGLRAVMAGQRHGRELFLTPVSITRYWEFPFTWRHLPASLGSCLDVGSPRLFALRVALERRPARVLVLNPDERDASVTRQLARLLGADCIEVEARVVASVAADRARYDAIWSISVLEHIPADGDIGAIRILYAALAPGGRLLVTVPVDQRRWDEHRPVDTYGLGIEPGPEGYFFQRWYDLEAIMARLVQPASADSVTLEWFGEREVGRFAGYIRRWLEHGRSVTLTDAVEIARHYRAFARWDDMPGQGVCGIVLAKAA
jgi:SAM-dependent methyltransferase